MAWVFSTGACILIVPFCLSLACDDSSTAPSLLSNAAGQSCSAQGKAYLDADGDGFARSTEGAIDCVGPGSAAPPGYALRLGDCDDDDPEVWTSYLADADGDGFAAGTIQSVCGRPDAVPAGAVGEFVGLDCDDSDPSRAWYARRDADGDGFGAEPAECLGTELPTAYVKAGGASRAPGELIDCDDARSAVHPSALELWSDSLDSDCDGSKETPEGCLSTACTEPVPIATGCVSADLTVLEFQSLSLDCVQGDWVVVVGNRGALPIPAFTISVGKASLHIPESLLPGMRRSYRLQVPLADEDGTIGASSEVEDCESSNNRVQDLIGTSCPI